MPSTERVCPQCQGKLLVVTDDAGDPNARQFGDCPHCFIKIVFETRTTFATMGPLDGGEVLRILPR